MYCLLARPPARPIVRRLYPELPTSPVAVSVSLSLVDSHIAQPYKYTIEMTFPSVSLLAVTVGHPRRIPESTVVFIPNSPFPRCLPTLHPVSLRLSHRSTNSRQAAGSSRCQPSVARPLETDHTWTVIV